MSKLERIVHDDSNGLDYILVGEIYLPLIWTYLADLNEQCVERRDFLMNQLMEQEGITEELKSRDQMEWVRQANNARSRVDEIILNELVYV